MGAFTVQNTVHSLSKRALFGRKPNQYYKYDAHICGSIHKVACSSEDEHEVHGSHSQPNGVPPFACRFGKTPDALHILAIADEDGHVALYDTRNGSIHVKEWAAHHNAIFDLAWSDTEPWVVTAAGDQTAALWDVSRGCRLAVFKQHCSSLKSVSFRHGDRHVFATGARDGKIMVWDIRCNHKEGPPSFHTPVNVISDTHVPTLPTTPKPAKRQRLASSPASSVTAVVFQDEHSIMSAGATESTIKVWDIRTIHKGRKPIPKHEYPYRGISTRNIGFSSLVLNSSLSRVYANCTDHVIYAFDCLGLNTHPVACYTGHSNATFYVKSALSVDDTFLLSGSSDSNAYIWKTNEPTVAPLQLTGHTAEVTSVTWSTQDFPKLVTCADDNSFRLWRQHNLSPKEMAENKDIVGKVTQENPKEVTTVNRQGSIPLPPCSSPRPAIKGGTSPVTPIQPIKPALKKNSSIKTFFARKRPASPDVCETNNSSDTLTPKVVRQTQKENTRKPDVKDKNCVLNGDSSSHSEHARSPRQLNGNKPILSPCKKDQTTLVCQNLPGSSPRIPLSPRKGCSEQDIAIQDNTYGDATKEVTQENGKENQRVAESHDDSKGTCGDRRDGEEGSGVRRMLSWPNSVDKSCNPCQGCNINTSPSASKTTSPKRKPSSKITSYFTRLSRGKTDQS